MWSVLRSRALSPCCKQLGFCSTVVNRSLCSSAAESKLINGGGELLKLEEVEKILTDVKADNIQVIPIPKHDFADYMVIATGRSAWHVRNIAQALIYKMKQKQKGAKRMLLPSVEGQEGGKWIVIDSGTLIIHALDEKVRTYYDLERLWATDDASNSVEDQIQKQDQDQALAKAFVKIRPKNNSKKRPKAIVPGA
ncbi:PREDICTED: protein Iojap-related, mitochondrial [Ipomoea nil]|uniref:protein Iojap-related, mitochondrial n=1 Tax=Ipomoea nil TaxID=35883 RepID=UPI000901E379|nr:PREDICTED: protein Iojap-related, mitochondrial [Ipomoea nil]